MERGRERGREQSGCLSHPGPPARCCFGPGPWPPLSSLLSSFLLPPLFPLLSLLLPSSSTSLLPPSPRGTPPPASSLPHHSTCQDEHAQGTTEVVVLRPQMLPWEQWGAGVSGYYKEDGGGRAKQGAEDAGSYSPVDPRLPVAEHTEGAGTVTTNKMAFSPNPTSFPGTHTPFCPQPSA